MSEFHDSNYYKRQRIIGKWALNLVMKLFMFEMALYILVRLWAQYTLFGMVPSKATTPYCYLIIGAFIVITAFFDLTRQLERFDAEVLKQKELADMAETPASNMPHIEEPVQNKTISDFPELLQAIQDKQISKDGRLLVKRSEFVKYCDSLDYFAPRNMESGWKPIGHLLKDRSNGKPVTAKQFRQTYQDLIKTGKV